MTPSHLVLHNMLPKYLPEVEGVTLVQTKSCRACDMEHERDKKYVRGGFYKRKYLTKKKVPFQVIYNEYYLKQLKKYTYHRFLKIILSKANTEDMRLKQLRPGEAIGSRDYAERLLMKFHKEIQSEHFGAGRDLSIEGNVVKFFPVGGTQTKTHFYSFLKDSRIQNAATTSKHMDRLIKILKKKNVLKDRLYETTDGCGAQYRSATALWFLSSLSAKHNIDIDRLFGAPGHGKLQLHFLLLWLLLFICLLMLLYIIFVIVVVVVVVVVMVLLLLLLLLLYCYCCCCCC
jgi:hypothetical protein